MDVGSLCRTCMSNRANAKKLKRWIYEKPTDCEDGPTIMDLLRSVQPEIHIHINDKLPKIICPDCIEQLQQAYEFVQMYKDTDGKFRKMLNDNNTTAPSVVHLKDTGTIVHPGEKTDRTADNSPVLKFEVDMDKEEGSAMYNHDVSGVHYPEFGGHSSIVKLEMEMDKLDDTANYDASAAQHPDSDEDYYPFGNASDESEWITMETSKRKWSNNQAVCKKQQRQRNVPSQNEDGSITCQECGVMLPSVIQWQTHIISHNSERIDFINRGQVPTVSDAQMNFNSRQFECMESPLSFGSSPAIPKKRKRFGVNVSSAINTEILKNLRDLDYKIIIGEYGTSCLENTERTRLAKIVIRHILQYNINIELTRYDFLFLADIITEVLPQEPKELYYSVAKFGQKASGKLYDAYNNYRKLLSQAGLLRRRPYVSKNMGRESIQDAQAKRIIKQMECIETQSFFEEFPAPTTNEEFDAAVSAAMNTEILRNLDDLDYRIIIGVHGASCLENTERTKLAKIVIKYVLQYDINIELTRYDFMFLADVIAQVLPKEPKDLYYSVAKFGQRASGKLYDAHNNYRKKLSQAGLLRRRAYVSKTTGADVVQKHSADFIYVKTNSTFNKDFIDKWQSCLTERQRILHNTDLPICEFLEQFPLFSTNDKCIFELFMRDVSAIYPSYSGIQSWDRFYNNVFNKLTAIKDSTAQEILKCSDNMNEDSKKAVAFLLLPYMFPLTVLRVQKKKNPKSSKIEVQEQFITHYETLEQADIFDRFSNELQPQLIFVGALNNLSAYVTLCGKRYFFERPLEAVEACFSSFMALNIKYPLETKTIWNFVQRYIFNISTQSDLNNIGIKTIYYKLTS